MKILLLVLPTLLFALACNQTPPPLPPPSPDASDAAVEVDAAPVLDAAVTDAAVMTDASPPAPAPVVVDAGADVSPPADACTLACQILTTAGCSEGRATTCAARLRTITGARLNPNPAKGNLPLTCGDFVGVKDAAGVRALGQKCNGL